MTATMQNGASITEPPAARSPAPFAPAEVPAPDNRLVTDNVTHNEFYVLCRLGEMPLKEREVAFRDRFPHMATPFAKQVAYVLVNCRGDLLPAGERCEPGDSAKDSAKRLLAAFGGNSIF